MFIQVIFFLALAAFIFLLARRYSPKNVTAAKAVGFFRSLAGWLVRVVVIAISRVRLPKLPTAKKTAQPPAPASPQPGDGVQSDFWEEDIHSQRQELSSHFEEGEQLFKKGRHKEAEQFFLKAAANNPSDAKVYARLGLLYLEQKNYSDAIESLKMAVKLEKYNPSRHYNLALAYWGNKDTRRAIASVREAISLDPVTPKYRKLLEQLLNG